MYKNYCVCEKASGRIKLNLTMPRINALDQCGNDDSLIEDSEGVSKPDRHYYDISIGEIIERPETSYSISGNEIVADGESSIVISDLEPDTEIDVSGPVNGHMVCDGDTESLQFDIPGEYRVTITAPFPACPVEVAINAT